MIPQMEISSFLMVRLAKSLQDSSYSTGENAFWRWLVDIWNRLYSGASFWTAIGTIALAGVTYKLVRETKEQGKSNHEANTRIYKQTQHQINLQYRADFYEHLLLNFEDLLIELRALATRLGIKFVSTSSDTQRSTQPVINENLLPIRLQLHASIEIRSVVLEWHTKWVAENEKLKDLLFSQVDPQLSNVQNEFQEVLKWLEKQKKVILEAMEKDLHPED